MSKHESEFRPISPFYDQLVGLYTQKAYLEEGQGHNADKLIGLDLAIDAEANAVAKTLGISVEEAKTAAAVLAKDFRSDMSQITPEDIIG